MIWVSMLLLGGLSNLCYYWDRWGALMGRPFKNEPQADQAEEHAVEQRVVEDSQDDRRVAG